MRPALYSTPSVLTVNTYNPGGLYRMFTMAFGVVQAAIFLFFFNMLMTLLAKTEQPH